MIYQNDWTAAAIGGGVYFYQVDIKKGWIHVVKCTSNDRGDCCWLIQRLSDAIASYYPTAQDKIGSANPGLVVAI